MVVLRSREILPTPPKLEPSQTSVPNYVVYGPVTPTKTSELLNQVSKGTSSTTHTLHQNVDDPGIDFGVGVGSNLVAESGRVRRHSARLAKKVNQNVEVVSGKRKIVEGNSISSVGRRNFKQRGSDMKLGVESSDGNPGANVVQEVSQDLTDEGVVELVKECENIEGSIRAAKLEFSCDMDSSGTETKDNDRIIRRPSMVENSLCYESSEKNKVEEGFLSLRSGKRVAKRENNDIVVNPFCGDSDQATVKLPESAGSEEVVKDKISLVSVSDPRTSMRLMSREGKGKMKVEVETSLFCGKRKLDAGPSSSSGINSLKLAVENANGSSVSGVEHSASGEVLLDGVQVIDANSNVSDTRNVHRERFRNIARKNAARFAHFSSHPSVRTEITHPESRNGIEDWPGPFSTAMKIIKDRESNRNGEKHVAFADKIEAVELKWSPKSHELCRHQKHVPSLQDICLSILSENADAITSLDYVPDALRHRICWFLCDSRRMDAHFVELLVHGSPTEIRIRDCSWLTEEQFAKIFHGCNTSKLTVLQFDQGGGCMPDYILCSALARTPNSLPALTAISLKGAYRLSDAGLSMLTSAAPSLKSIDVSQCPLLTAEGICCLASSLRLVLRELYIDNCHGIDAMLILPALEKLENLEVLSVAGIMTICDDFVTKFVSAHGYRMKEFILADCMDLTDSSLEVIGDTCSDLRAIDLTNLCKLTDISIGRLANGCQAIQTLKLCRNAFSDEAIAAYLDVRGASLKSLSLNNIIQVSNHTALSLSRNCKNLWSLDLSWCRNITNEALGLIVDSCLFLEVLKLFGCTQINSVFLDGYSNLQVKIIGLKMTPVFKHIVVPDFLLGALRYPSACP